MQKQDIMGFLHGFLHSFLQGLGNMQRHGGLGDEIVEGIEKSRKKLFTIGISIALAGTGFFLILWGIASTIDTIFAMRGLGFVIVGIIAILTGALTYKK
ncbi:MAG: hypothetical protein FIB08_11050 [Candidatus Methanoperedens sp.]|nr:hypothetical protein [Candidatus Methanoperedens sp.]